MNYQFKNIYIKNNFENKREYYYLGFQSAEYYITKIIYNYLSKVSDEIEFCCDFKLLQRIVKKISSKEYLTKIRVEQEMYIYSYIGAMICDNANNIEYEIDRVFKIEEFLLSIYKKETSKYKFVKKFIKDNNYEFNAEYIFAKEVTCNVNIFDMNVIFTNTGTSMIDSLYNTVNEINQYLLDNRMYFPTKDIAVDYNVNNSYDKLEELFENNYINKPSYQIIEHDESDDIKYEVRCSVSGYNFYSVKIHNNKEISKNLAAYSMLKMIIDKNK